MEEFMAKLEFIFSRNVRAWILVAFFFLIPALDWLYPVPKAVGYFFSASGIAYWIALFIYCEIRLSRIDKSNVLYLEKTASGYSHLNLLTKLGGSRNCLKVQLTKDYLLICSWFPFSLIAPLFDGVHIIPVGSIVSLTHRKGFLTGNEYRLSFKMDSSDQLSTFSIYPKKAERFEAVFARYMVT